MFYFKACPKCSGDLYLDKDQYGTFVECVQCGLVRDVKLNQAFNEVGSAVMQTSAPPNSSREVVALAA
ncbi:MAG: hypothetical protein ACE5Q6_06450 [Dehalococcoidia bacterium]